MDWIYNTEMLMSDCDKQVPLTVICSIYIITTIIIVCYIEFKCLQCLTEEHNSQCGVVFAIMLYLLYYYS